MCVHPEESAANLILVCVILPIMDPLVINSIVLAPIGTCPPFVLLTEHVSTLIPVHVPIQTILDSIAT